MLSRYDTHKAPHAAVRCMAHHFNLHPAECMKQLGADIAQSACVLVHHGSQSLH